MPNLHPANGPDLAHLSLHLYLSPCTYGLSWYLQVEKNKLSAKEVALTKMLVATSILFIVCLVPILMVQIATFLVKDLNYDGRYHNLTSVLWQSINAFRCLNSSLNFFIYFHMGSKFRETLRELLRLGCCRWKE